MTKQLSEKQRALLREGIQAGKEGLQSIANMNRLLDEIQQETRSEQAAIRKPEGETTGSDSRS